MLINMKMIICDDDPNAVAVIHDYVKSYFEARRLRVPELCCFYSGEEVLKTDYFADMAFLDIEMPGISGIHLGQKMKKKNPFVKIFIITSYQEYLDEAMRFHVFRYLSKPLDKGRLYRNMRDAMKQYCMESIEIPLITKDGVHRVRSNEIICAETDGRTTMIHTIDASYASLDTMEYWLKKLKLGCFFQSFRSVIVNMAFVSSFDSSTIKLRWGNKKEMDAYLARRRSRDFKETYITYLESIR